MTLMFYFLALCALPLASQAAVSAAEQAEFLKVHNDYRAALGGGQYGGPATDMQELQWDADLAAGAQKWADTCAQGHDSNSARQTASNKNSYVGQNAAWGYGTIAAAAAGWWDEYKCTVFPSGVPGGYPVQACNCQYGCGHFTQMAWTATTHVGCGINTACSMKTYFCNYYPGGNFDWGGRQDYVYRKGSPACSNCAASGGSSSQTCTNNMCANGSPSGPSGPSGPSPTPKPTPSGPPPTPQPTKPTPQPTTPPPVAGTPCPTAFYGSGYRFSWWTPLLNGNQQLVQDGWNSIKYGGCFQEVKITYTPNISPGWYDKIDVRGTSGYFWGTSEMINDLKSNMAARKKTIEDYVKARVGASATNQQGQAPPAPAGTESCSPSPCGGASSGGDSGDKKKTDVPLIVGAVIGSVAALCLMAGLIYYMMQRKQQQQRKDEERLMAEQTPYKPPVVM